MIVYSETYACILALLLLLSCLWMPFSFVSGLKLTEI